MDEVGRVDMKSKSGSTERACGQGKGQSSNQGIVVHDGNQERRNDRKHKIPYEKRVPNPMLIVGTASQDMAERMNRFGSSNIWTLVRIALEPYRLSNRFPIRVAECFQLRDKPGGWWNENELSAATNQSVTPGHHREHRPLVFSSKACRTTMELHLQFPLRCSDLIRRQISPRYLGCS